MHAANARFAGTPRRVALQRTGYRAHAAALLELQSQV
jgi:hypothetical protein